MRSKRQLVKDLLNMAEKWDLDNLTNDQVDQISDEMVIFMNLKPLSRSYKDWIKGLENGEIIIGEWVE